MLKEIDEKLKEYQNETISKSTLNRAIKENKRAFLKSVEEFESVIINAIDMLQYDIESFKANSARKRFETNGQTGTKKQNTDTEQDDTILAKMKCILNTSPYLTNMRVSQSDEHGYYLETTMNELFAELQAYDKELTLLKRFYKENMAFVKVFYKSMAVQHTIQSRTYDFWSFLCDIGTLFALG